MLSTTSQSQDNRLQISSLNNLSSYVVYLNSDICNASWSKNTKAIGFASNIEINQIDDINGAYVLICATHSQVVFNVSNFGEPYAAEDENVEYRITGDDNWHDGIMIKLSNVVTSSGITIEVKNIEADVTTAFNLNASFSQDASIIRSVPINKPLYKSNSKVKYVDNAVNSSNAEFTSVSDIKIGNSTRHFGIKRNAFFYKDTNSDFAIPEKPNVKGEVVLLRPVTEQKQIYSFKNGEQYLQLTRNALSRPRLLPHYIYSYEYIIDGIIPSENSLSTENLKLFGANGKESSSNIAANISIKEIEDAYSGCFTGNNFDQINDIFYTYSFVASYMYEEQTPYTKIIKPKGLEKISTTTFETTYAELTTEDYAAYLQNIMYVDIFEQDTTYTIIGNYVSQDEAIAASTSAQVDEQKYWIFDSKSSTYIEANATTIGMYENMPDIYAKHTAYVKVSSDLLNPNDMGSSKKYVQKYEFTEYANKNEECHEDFLYIKNGILDNIYMPIKTGIVGDGSLEYYSNTYVSTTELTEEELHSFAALQEPIDPDSGDEEQSISGGVRVFIKQHYRQIGMLEFETTDISKLYTAIGNEPIYFELTRSDEYIFDLDINGTTVYADRDRNVISLDRLRKIYFDNDADGLREWYTKNTDEELIKGRLQEMSLPAFGIYYRIDYKGRWGKITITDPNGSYGTFLAANPSGLFVKENAYVEIDFRKADFLSNNEFFIMKLAKTRLEDINFNDKVYVDVSKYSIYEYSDVDGEEIILHDGKTLARVNQYGFITNDSIKYFTRTPIYAETNDLYMFLDKDYYAGPTTVQKLVKTEVLPMSFLEMTYDGNASQPRNNFNDEKYKEVSGALAKFLIANGNTSYLYKYDNNNFINVSDGYDEHENYYIMCASYACIDKTKTTIARIGIKPYSNATIDISYVKFFANEITHYILSYETSNELLRSYDLQFVKTRYFYPDMVINNGLHYAKDGSYYTNVVIYDGTRGSISKALTLQPNVFNVTNYMYDYEASTYVDVYKDDVANVNENHYKDFYLSYNDESGVYHLDPLSLESQSPTYWLSYINYLGESTYSLKTKVTAKKTDLFNGKTTNNEGYDEVQYFNNTTYEPVIIRKNDLMFGIIFHEKMSSGITEIEEIDDRITWSSYRLMTSPIIAKGHQTDMRYAYEYDVVELKEVVYDGYEDDDNVKIYQKQQTIYNDLKKTTPFFISNEKELNFTGTYTWNNPKHSYIFVDNGDNTYKAIDIMLSNGYWNKDTIENQIPLKVSSYNFYVNKDEVSSTTATYMYLPMSYVVSAEIYHPAISYDYIVNEKKEVARYTYIYDGKEYNYPSTDIVQENEDGTYTGKITIEVHHKNEDNEDVVEHVDQLVQLVKYIDIDDTSSVKTITHQDEHISYELFTYKNSIALVNERVPLLYNTEFVPAGTHKVQIWNEDADTYTIKTVVDSYAHYVYNYKYETIPLVVSSYLVAGDNFNISNIPVISYSIDAMSYEFGKSMQMVDASLNTMSGTMLSTSNSLVSSLVSSIGKVDTYIASSSESLSKSIIDAAYIIEEKPTVVISYIHESPEYSYIVSYAIDDLTSRVGIETRDLKVSIAEKLDNLNDSMAYQSSLVHTYWMNITYSYAGNVIYAEKRDRQLKKKSVVETLDDALNYHDISVKTTYNPDGTYDRTLESKIKSIAEILDNLVVSKKIPTYDEFMVDLVPKLYANCDFEREIVDTQHIDENGNVLSSGKHKPNPIDLAKKAIYRADILWKEMQNKGIINK